MTDYRVVCEVATFLNDGGPTADMVVIEPIEIWHGDYLPSTEELRTQVAGNLPPEFEQRRLTPNPTSANEFMRRHYPLSQFEDRVRRPNLLVQQQRTPKLLGWKTLQLIGIDQILPDNPEV